MNNILSKYGFSEGSYTIHPYGTGLINHTWLLQETMSGKKYILQRINHKIFRNPEDIAFNINAISNYIRAHKPAYHFEAPLPNSEGKDMVVFEGEYYRLFSFVEKSHTIDVVKNQHQAYEAAFQFGKFTYVLDHFDATQLRITLPDFHNLPLRYQQFKTALLDGNPARIQESEESIKFLIGHEAIAKRAEKVRLKRRVIHHDTKISNVLLDEQDNGLCVIDLDTVMPGFFISDLGDMMRTYLSPVSEEEGDFSKVEVRVDYFEAVVSGYLGSGMADVMTNDEKEMLVYSGKFMIYMQALRFITDYLNDDSYYGARYEKQNLVRGQNQICLLQNYTSREQELSKLCNKIFK